MEPYYPLDERIVVHDHLATIQNLGGFYRAPEDTNGKLLGPLVGYAGKDEEGKQLVGKVYVNFAKAERHPRIMHFFSEKLTEKIRRSSSIKNPSKGFLSGFCGAPEGGKSLANILALVNGLEYIYLEKQVTEVASATAREKSQLIFGRHEPEKGSCWILVEDICNNFSTTEKMIRIMHKRGARVVAIVCFLNRSPTIDDTYRLGNNKTGLPVIALVREAMNEWRQSDYAVKSEIARRNVVWSPKKEWRKLAPFIR